MDQYKNLGGDSGVVGFEIEHDSITVLFRDGWTYVYNYQCTGNQDVERMKVLAVAGQGLNSFISRFIKKRYASKHR